MRNHWKSEWDKLERERERELRNGIEYYKGKWKNRKRGRGTSWSDFCWLQFTFKTLRLLATNSSCRPFQRFWVNRVNKMRGGWSLLLTFGKTFEIPFDLFSFTYQLLTAAWVVRTILVSICDVIKWPMCHYWTMKLCCN